MKNYELERRAEVEQAHKDGKELEWIELNTNTGKYESYDKWDNHCLNQFGEDFKFKWIEFDYRIKEEVKMTTQYINANIKSKRELAQRLLDGEVFYLGNGCTRLYFDETDGNSPFRIVQVDCTKVRYASQAMEPRWIDYHSLQIKKEVKWYDKLDGTAQNGVYCFVWDDGYEFNPLKPEIELIVAYHAEESGFYGASGIFWQNAKPMTAEDLK